MKWFFSKVSVTGIIVTFLIYSANATIVSVAPDSAEQGQTLSVCILGQDSEFQIVQGSGTVNNVSTVSLTRNSNLINAGSFSISSKTSLNASFTIGTNDSAGLYDVSVTQTSNGLIHTMSNGFTITTPDVTPKIVIVAPNLAEPGEILSVCIVGKNTSFTIVQGSGTINNVNKVYFKRDGTLIEGSDISSSSKTSLTSLFSLPNNTPVGSYDVSVIQNSKADTITLIQGFTINTLGTKKTVARWPFDEGADDTVHDVSNNNNHGFITGAAWNPGISESALTFDGIDDNVRVADNSSLDITKGLSVESWVKCVQSPGDYQVILAKWYDDSYHSYLTTASYILEIAPDDARPRLVLNLTSGRVDVEANDIIPLNKWTYVAGTYDGARARVYINGHLSAEEPATGTIIPGTSPVMVGAHDHTMDTNPFRGPIDEVSLYNYALHPDTILSHFINLNLITSYWTFNEGTGDSVFDTGKNNNPGVINGALWGEGVLGDALHFNGINSNVEINDDATLDFSQAVTLEVWVKPIKMTADYRVIIAKWYDNSLFDPNTTASYLLELDPLVNVPLFTLNLVTGRKDLRAVGEIPLNEWSQVVGTYDGTTSKIYINGKFDNELAANGKIVAGTSPVMIGAHDHTSDTNPFNGGIDEVSLYNYAMTSDNVWKHYLAINQTSTKNTIFSPKNRITIDKNRLVIYNTDKLPVSVQLYAVNGRRLLHKTFKPSQFIITTPTNNFASGIYFYRVQIGSTVSMKPFVINK